MPIFRLSSGLKEEKVLDTKVPTFCIDDILGSGEALLNGSDNKEYETETASSEEQKERLHAEMGLDVASKLGICEDLVTNDDLMENEQNLSAREKNVQKRQKRKQAKERDESSKKMKIAMQVYSVTDSQKESLSNVMWPLEIFTQFLRKDLKSSAWEERHGAATALREIISKHGVSGGLSGGQSTFEMRQANVQWLHDLAFELLARIPCPA